MVEVSYEEGTMTRGTIVLSREGGILWSVTIVTRKGIKRRDCEELTKHLEERRKEEVQKKIESANMVVDGVLTCEGDVCSVITDENISNL